MAEVLLCWRCGKSLEALSLPLARLDECPECTIPLHVCRMCVFYDPRVVRHCREDDAEEVKEKDRANFCDYFRPSAAAHNPAFSHAEARARSQLESLFGGDTSTQSSAGSSLPDAEALFGKKP